MVSAEKGSRHEQPDGSELIIHDGYRITRDASIRDPRELGYRVMIEPGEFVKACQRMGLSSHDVSLHVVKSLPVRPGRREVRFGLQDGKTGEITIATDPHADIYRQRTGRELKTFRGESDLQAFDVDALEVGVNQELQHTIIHELGHRQVRTVRFNPLYMLYHFLPLPRRQKYRWSPEERYVNNLADNSPIQPRYPKIVSITHRVGR